MLAPDSRVGKLASGRVLAVSSSCIPTVSPMHPTLVREPFHRDGWIYEETYDSLADGGFQTRRPRPTRQPKRSRSHRTLCRNRPRGMESARSWTVSSKIFFCEASPMGERWSEESLVQRSPWQSC